MNDSALFDELAQLAAQQIGLRIPDDAHDRFIGILRERARHHGCPMLEDYRKFIAGRQAAGEWEELARVFTTGETFFFRDHGQFDLMRLRLLPELIERRCGEKTLRLWSAGCASGEETYSLAMLVDMLLPERSGWDVLILGTDIDSEAIAKARRGYYGKWSFRMVPPEIQQRYFHTESATHNPQSAIRNPQSAFILDERIRRMVAFRVSNLVGEPFPDSASELHDMDLILCRNVFIYFAPAAVAAVAAKFAATLRERGYLLTAHTELIGHPVQGLESRLFAEGVVYQRQVQLLALHPDGTTFPHPNLPQKVGNPLSGKPDVEPAAGEGVIAPSLARSAGEGWGGGNGEALLKEARAYADRGEYDEAEQACHKALGVDPLAAAPYFLLAQLAQIKCDFNRAMECLNKAIYLDSNFVAAYLELAALCERAGDLPRAHTLRRTALGIVRTMPNGEVIGQYETTAGELVQWLTQWEA